MHLHMIARHHITAHAFVCGLGQVNNAAAVIYENVDPDANIIFGALVDDKLKTGEIEITVVATGFTTEDSAAGPSTERQPR
jgi:cell division protein FtsZ